MWLWFLTFSCPPDVVEIAFHRLVTVEPLSATTRLQAVAAPGPLFVTVTSAQYPLPHCDWSARSAFIVLSALLTADSKESLSSRSAGSMLQASRQHANERET